MTEMFGEAWSPMSVPDLAPDDDDDDHYDVIVAQNHLMGGGNRDTVSRMSEGVRVEFRL